jgi:multidrug resistance efflux pump
MTDQADTHAAAPAPTRPEPAPAAEASAATGRAGKIILLLIVLVVGLHIVADRRTPFSSQARVHANVVPLAAEVAGPVEAVHVRNNQLVVKGQPLFTVSDANYAIARDKAEADLSATQRELKAQDEAIAAALAQRQIAVSEMERSRIDAERHQRIYSEDKGAISVRRLELVQASYRESVARVAAADAQVAQARAARGATGPDNDRLVAARSALAKAELDMGRTTVRAPGAGLVTDLQLDRGQFAAAGSPVLTFIAIHDAWITADMTENNLGHIRPGQPAEIVLDVLPGQVLRGEVRSVGRGVASGGRNQPGALPDIQNNRDFLRQAQRFPVQIRLVEPTAEQVTRLREGGQADVIVYTGDNGLLNALGRLYIRAAGLLSYAY